MQTTAFVVSWRNGWGDLIGFKPFFVVKSAARAYLGIMAIAIVLYGIYSGVFSPTEAAGITVGFTVLSGLFVARSIRFRDIPDVLIRSSKLTAMLAPMVAISVVMQQIFAVLGVQAFVNDVFATLGGGYYGVLLLCMAIILVSGMILESIPNTIIFAPILAPIAVAAGVDPIHFAVIFLVGTAIGFITPPYGLNLYVASGVTGIPYLRLVQFVMRYLIALIAAWLIIAMWPALSEVIRIQY